MGKNSTDSALIIDAMDLLYSGNLDAFAIVSSDSDFTRLATRLRESGKTVYGLGRRRTPDLAAERLRPVHLPGGARGRGRAAQGRRPTRPRTPSLPDLRVILEAAIETASQDDGWASLGPVGNYLNKTHASFDPRNYGFTKLSALARAQDYLEVEQRDGRPPRVRLKSEPPATKAAKTSGRRRTAKKAPAKKA